MDVGDALPRALGPPSSLSLFIVSVLPHFVSFLFLIFFPHVFVVLGGRDASVPLYALPSLCSVLSEVMINVDLPQSYTTVHTCRMVWLS